MMTIIFYIIVSGFLVFNYGHLWLEVLWCIVLLADIAVAPGSISRAKKQKKTQDELAEKAKQFDHIVRVAEKETKDSWLKECIKESLTRLGENK